MISDLAATVVIAVLVFAALYMGWMIDRWTQRLGEEIRGRWKGLRRKIVRAFTV